MYLKFINHPIQIHALYLCITIYCFYRPAVITTSPSLKESFNTTARDTDESTDRGNNYNHMIQQQQSPSSTTSASSPLNFHHSHSHTSQRHHSTSSTSPRSSPRHTQHSPLPTLRLKSPSHSVSEGTPTYTDFTEGTPSYTASSPSCSSDVLGMTRLSSLLSVFLIQDTV